MNGDLRLTGTQILVVDDEIDNLELIAFILQQAGATVTSVRTAQEAIQTLNGSIPDVLLSDIGLPDVDGYMLLRQIRSRPAHQGGKIPAIAISAYASDDDQQQALEAGFQLHIAKPTEPDKLLQAIAALIQPQSTYL